VNQEQRVVTTSGNVPEGLPRIDVDYPNYSQHTGMMADTTQNHLNNPDNTVSGIQHHLPQSTTSSKQKLLLNKRSSTLVLRAPLKSGPDINIGPF
jgi:hypothetical protein